MSRSLALEDFSPQAIDMAVEPEPVRRDEETISLEVYESGYKAGWADCATAEAEERRAVGADLAARLREAELTIDTARKEILESLAPFFDELVRTLLPSLASEAVAPMVVQELNALLDDYTDAEAEIRAAPGVCPILRRLIDANGDRMVAILPEPALAECQVFLRVGNERRNIDLSQVTDKISQAVRALQADFGEPTYSKGVA